MISKTSSQYTPGSFLHTLFEAFFIFLPLAPNNTDFAIYLSLSAEKFED